MKEGLLVPTDFNAAGSEERQEPLERGIRVLCKRKPVAVTLQNGIGIRERLPNQARLEPVRLGIPRHSQRHGSWRERLRTEQQPHSRQPLQAVGK